MNVQRLAQLRALMASDPTDPFYPYAIAQEYLGAQKYTEACAHYKDVYTRFPDYLPTYYQYAVALGLADQYRAAVEILKQGLIVAREQGDTKTAGEIASLLEDIE